MLEPEIINERRIFERFPARFPAKFKDTREDFGEKVFLRNASADGAQFTTRDRLYIHDHVSLEVHLPDSTHPLELRGEVIWAKVKSNNDWDIGLRLHQIDLVKMSRLYQLTL